MKTSTLAPLLLLLTSCGDRALPVSDDGGVGRDLRPAAVDLGGITCGQIVTGVSSWLAAHRGCKVDGDCRIVESRCGLEGFCGTFANSDPGFEALVALWDQKGCGAAIDCGACPDTYPRTPACVAGVCAARTDGAVGDACSSDSACRDGAKCVKTSGFTGGYCTFANCDFDGAPACPQGSICLSHDGGVSYCLKTCTPTAGACGRDGYDCCGSGVAVCSPSTSSRCNPR